MWVELVNGSSGAREEGFQGLGFRREEAGVRCAWAVRSLC